MKSRLLPAVLFALAFASPAFAAWTPMVPGWSVHEVPLSLSVAMPYNWQSLALDPLSGDVFLIGAASQGSPDYSLYRVSPAGQVSNLAAVPYPSFGLVFDAVHRIVLLPGANSIARFAENGASLPPIASAGNGPVAAGPDGELYAVVPSIPSATGLRIVHYDMGADAWLPVRDVPPTQNGFFPLDGGNPPVQLAIDAAGKLFVSPSSAIVYRIDDQVCVGLGSYLLSSQLAVGSGMAFLGGVFWDSGAAGPASPQGFAAPAPGHRDVAIAAAPTGEVVGLDFRQDPDLTEHFALEFFSTAPTPAVQRSWGALKAAAR
jgi:hypothetical protein